jgi:repressor LexA
MIGPVPLTEAQERALDYIKSRRRSPSIREICTHLGFKSTKMGFDLVCALEERGFIRKMPNRPRAIQVIENPRLPDEGLAGYTTDELLGEIRRRRMAA